MEARYQGLCSCKFWPCQRYLYPDFISFTVSVSHRSSSIVGFPSDNIQVYELYNSKSQIFARTHPALIDTQRFLLTLWHTSDPNTEISLSTPISYFDRLRIRHPGDSKFALGPHIDGGSLERWEDPGYRSCFKKILEGGSNWRQHDPYDASPRIGAKQDLYHGSCVPLHISGLIFIDVRERL